ncbi:hypothetical protein L598_000800000320 [Mesorhizobium sp. J18]|uniref:hypothetical protein n=1 Tax=Mesorhizobium sp. J18 TaxID=935263 RepID=UPI00119A1501|nr:hypothetical protein [Mesorhizobium sp. J18]TWG89568.1 hypothetical protein L598_000800000320 [Mesorhizobium sp. J18]
MQKHHLPPHVVMALRPFFAQQRHKRPVPLSAVVRATRQAVPDLPYSDEVLADLLAKEIMRSGCAIEFDRNDTPIH